MYSILWEPGLPAMAAWQLANHFHMYSHPFFIISPTKPTPSKESSDSF
jgi:hypothetical protein